MSSAHLSRPRPRIHSAWFAVPAFLLLLAAVFAAAGHEPVPAAPAATTDNVTVTATVGSALDVADQCAGAMAITVTMAAYSDGTCAVNFGATNDASVTLRANSSAGAFFSGNFADEGATCANLATVDEAGLKVVSVGAGVTNQWGCALGAATDNTTTSHKGVPDSATAVCLSSATGVTNTCTLGVGVLEVGSDATAGSYTGTLNLDVIG